MTLVPTKSLRGLVIAGTDTGVGKTLVGAGLLRLAADRGLRLVPFKPAESGCASLRSPADATLLRAAAGRPDIALQDVCPYAFRLPVAPAAAAARAGRPVRWPRVRDTARRLAAQGDALLVEGAGGVLSPYGPRLTLLDLAARLGLPVLLVARNALGTINHTALAVAEIRRRQLPLLGYVLVDTSPRPRVAERNAQLIRQLTGLSPCATLPFFRAPSARATAATLARHRPLARLLGALARG